jgi:hypothetical protein
MSFFLRNMSPHAWKGDNEGAGYSKLNHQAESVCVALRKKKTG